MPVNRPRAWLLPTLAIAAAAAFAAPHDSVAEEPAKAARSIDDYRDFRALSIDLVGRIPTRDELAAFERSDWKRDAWIESHLATSAYAERLTRVYMDVLRLEVNGAVVVNPPATTLRRTQITGPDGKPELVYFRRGQRRANDATDGEFCFTKDETGLELVSNQPPKGTAIPVKKELLEERTVLVRPWWLYRDFLQLRPEKRLGEGWTNVDPGYALADRMLKNADGTPTEEVRVCKEEAQPRDFGTIYATGRTPPAKGAALPAGRTKPLPLDDGYAKQHKGEPISCRDALAINMSVDCGCGVGLQYCLPGDSDADQPSAFMLPTHSPLGAGVQYPLAPQTDSTYTKYWWTAEAVQFFAKLFKDDRDFREVLTARDTVINGPLSQYYRSTAPASCCARERAFGMNEETEPLFDPSRVPAALFPQDVGTWLVVPDRGPHASGILTMPVFLEKFASRRARAAVLYSAFLCKSFVSSNAELLPSTEPNLMVRPGCASCHATLEPLAAYFSRVEETSAVYLPIKNFPIKNPNCKLGKNGKAPGFCDAFYDPAFGDPAVGTLRGAYASPEHAELGPQGIAKEMTAAPEFASCAVTRVAGSLLGRQLSPDDDALVAAWTEAFTRGGYRMKPLVTAVLGSDAYRKANNARGGAPPATPVTLAPEDAVHGAAR